MSDQKAESWRKKRTFYNTLSPEDKKLVVNLHSERNMRLRLCVDKVDETTNNAQCKFCSVTYKAFSSYWEIEGSTKVGERNVTKKQYEQAKLEEKKTAIRFTFCVPKVVEHLTSSCSAEGLTEIIKILVTDRGVRDNSSFFASNKKRKLDEETLNKQLQNQEILDAIEELVTDALPHVFECRCGEEIATKHKTSFSAVLKAHLSTYCPYFKTWRQVFLALPSVDGTTADIIDQIAIPDEFKDKPNEWSELLLKLDPIGGERFDIEECRPFGEWQNKKKKAIYYDHTWNEDVKATTYSDLFVKETISYHGSTTDFNRRTIDTILLKTVDSTKEAMTPILAGNKEQVKLVEAFAQVMFNFKCEVKNSQLELLQIVNSFEDEGLIESALRSLLRGIRHQFDERVSVLSAEQLQFNRKQYVDEAVSKLLAREI